MSTALSIHMLCQYSAFILKHKFCNLHIQLIILCQKNTVLDRCFRFFLQLQSCPSYSCQSERNPDQNVVLNISSLLSKEMTTHFPPVFCTGIPSPVPANLCGFLVRSCAMVRNSKVSGMPLSSDPGISADKFHVVIAVCSDGIS